MSLTFVQGDTDPAITATIIKDSDGSAVNLTGSTVKFQMRKADDRRFTVNAVATLVDAPTGRVAYSWAANDLATPGTYSVQWEVTYSNGRVQTTSLGEIEVRRQ